MQIVGFPCTRGERAANLFGIQITFSTTLNDYIEGVLSDPNVSCRKHASHSRTGS